MRISAVSALFFMQQVDCQGWTVKHDCFNDLSLLPAHDQCAALRQHIQNSGHSTCISTAAVPNTPLTNPSAILKPPPSTPAHRSRLRIDCLGARPVKDASWAADTATWSETPVPALAKSSANRPASRRRIHTHTQTGWLAQEVKFPPMIFTP